MDAGCLVHQLTDEERRFFLEQGYLIVENAVDFNPHPLASEEYECRGNEEQRQRLEYQVHEVLKTQDAASCELEFFASRSLLQRGFLSYAQYTHQ